MTCCEVCCDSFNKSNHALVTCPFCPYAACTSCHERYLCETTEDAHCMNCRKGWTRETLVNNFTFKFVSRTYKKRREDLLFEREKSLMPATQPYVEIEKEIREIRRHITAKKAEWERAQEKYYRIANRPLALVAADNNIHLEFHASIIRHKAAAEQHKVTAGLRIEADHLEWHERRLMEVLAGGSLDSERRQFVRACPVSDCKGFLSTVWKCGLCDNWACPDCHEVKGKEKDAEHTCDPDNVATAKLLAKDSRNCPKCAATIFKIDGCDQMWCTQCHTAFGWRTGRIETHVIHNPHYYEYMRNHGGMPRAAGDIPCGGFPNVRAVMALISRDDYRLSFITNAHMIWGHLQWMLPRYEVNIHQDNRDLRIKLMIGDISEDVFKQRIQQREKARHRKTDIRQVIEMIRTVLVDLFQDFVRTKDVHALHCSLTELREHYNNTLDTISKNYGKCVVPKLTGNFTVL